MRCFSVWDSPVFMGARTGDSPVFMGVRTGDKMGICHHLETGTKNQKILEN